MSGVAFWMSGFVFWVSGVVFRMSGFVFWLSGLVFWLRAPPTHDVFKIGITITPATAFFEDNSLIFPQARQHEMTTRALC